MGQASWSASPHRKTTTADSWVPAAPTAFRLLVTGASQTPVSSVSSRERITPIPGTTAGTAAEAASSVEKRGGESAAAGYSQQRGSREQREPISHQQSTTTQLLCKTTHLTFLSESAFFYCLSGYGIRTHTGFVFFFLRARYQTGIIKINHLLYKPTIYKPKEQRNNNSNNKMKGKVSEVVLCFALPF